MRSSRNASYSASRNTSSRLNMRTSSTRCCMDCSCDKAPVAWLHESCSWQLQCLVEDEVHLKLFVNIRVGGPGSLHYGDQRRRWPHAAPGDQAKWRSTASKTSTSSALKSRCSVAVSGVCCRVAPSVRTTAAGCSQPHWVIA